MTMQLYDDLLQSIQGEDCEVRRVVIGLHLMRPHERASSENPCRSYSLFLCVRGLARSRLIAVWPFVVTSRGVAAAPDCVTGVYWPPCP